jgi:hypothetical protein
MPFTSSESFFWAELHPDTVSIAHIISAVIVNKVLFIATPFNCMLKNGLYVNNRQKSTIILQVI